MQIISQGNNYIVQFDLYSDLTNIANNVIGNLTYNNTQLTLVSMTVTPTIGTQSTLNTNQYLFGTVFPNKHYTVACVFTVLQESNLIPITWTISTSNPETTLANNSKTINLVDYLDGLLASDICANLQGCVVTARTRFLEVLPSGEWLWENYNPANNAQLSTFTTPAPSAQIITSADSSITVVGSDLSVTHTVNPDGSVTLNDGTVISAPIPETITTIVNNGNGTATYTNEAGIPITFPIGGVTAVDNSDGTYTLTLADGSTVTISDTSTSTMVNNLDGTYTYTDETGVTTTFSTIDVTTTVTNTVAGNKIADYTNELGVVVAINETVSTVLNNGNGTVTFTNEAGATVTFPIGGVSIIDNADGTYTVTLADGNVVTIGDTSISTLVDNLDGTYTYTNEAGVVTTFDTTGVITTITNTVSGNKIADYTNEAGAVVPINETITSFAAITDGYQYVSEDGTVYPFTFTFDNTTPSAPQLLINYGATVVSSIPLNSYDVNINTTGGFTLNPLTDEITITETDGQTHTIDLSYLKTTLTSVDGSVEIVPSVNPDGSINYDVGVKSFGFEVRTIPFTGVEVPTTPGVNIGDTKSVYFTSGETVHYTWDGSNWILEYSEDNVELRFCLNSVGGFSPLDPNNPTTAEVETWKNANLGLVQQTSGTILTYFVPGDGGSCENPDYTWTLNKGSELITLSNKRVFNTKTVYVDAGSGSDVTGRRGYREFPFKTHAAAMVAYQSGDVLKIQNSDLTLAPYTTNSAEIKYDLGYGVKTISSSLFPTTQISPQKVFIKSDGKLLVSASTYITTSASELYLDLNSIESSSNVGFGYPLKSNIKVKNYKGTGFTFGYFRILDNSTHNIFIDDYEINNLSLPGYVFGIINLENIAAVTKSNIKVKLNNVVYNTNYGGIFTWHSSSNQVYNTVNINAELNNFIQKGDIVNYTDNLTAPHKNIISYGAGPGGNTFTNCSHFYKIDNADIDFSLARFVHTQVTFNDSKVVIEVGNVINRKLSTFVIGRDGFNLTLNNSEIYVSGNFENTQSLWNFLELRNIVMTNSTIIFDGNFIGNSNILIENITADATSKIEFRGNYNLNSSKFLLTNVSTGVVSFKDANIITTNANAVSGTTSTNVIVNNTTSNILVADPNITEVGQSIIRNANYK